jgi:hypothetical protein
VRCGERSVEEGLFGGRGGLEEGEATRPDGFRSWAEAGEVIFGG